ncbi:forkhead-associated protein, putative [Babesia caballi]|uniref:Forkhead-associated protein, putative n=1 Tax=Babesia caballi TaxID=5871 RepID=A0AAV4LSU8_BABCB|nr:forkhead-associated protein, putative [Babesia caballi]
MQDSASIADPESEVMGSDANELPPLRQLEERTRPDVHRLGSAHPLGDDDVSDVRKHRFDFRTPRRRHYQYKLQRVSSSTLDSLNLATVRPYRSLSRQSSVSQGVGILNVSPASRLSVSTTDGAATTDSTRQVSHRDFTQGSSDSPPGAAQGCLDGSSTSTGGYGDEASPFVRRDRDAPLPGANLSIDEATSRRASIDPIPQGCDLHNLMHGPGLSLRNLSSLSSLLSEDRQTSISTTINAGEPAYVESDCEGCCVSGEFDGDGPPAGSGDEMPHHVPSELPTATLDISDVVDAANELTANNGGYTYSPDPQLGVLRLFFQQDAGAARPAEPTLVPRRVVVNKSPFVLGHDASCDLVFEREKYRHVYGRHCKVVFTACDTGEPGLRSMGISAYQAEVIKTNPDAIVCVNSVSVRLRAPLRNGDVLALGPKKVSVSFTVAFRTREACVALLDQLNSLMLTPSSALRLQRQPHTPSHCESAGASPSRAVARGSRDLDLEFHVNVAVFELYYGESTLDGAFSQDWVATPCTENSLSQLSPGSFGALVQDHTESYLTTSRATTQAPPADGHRAAQLHEAEADSDVGDSRSPYCSLRVSAESCSVSQTPTRSTHYEDDASLAGNLLLSAYTTSLRDAPPAPPSAKPGTLGARRPDDVSAKISAAKVAKLRSLNRASVPIVLDTSRSLSSEEDNRCLTVAKLRFLGVLSATYQTTLEELLPAIDALLQGYQDPSPGSRVSALADYELLIKRHGQPLSAQEAQYNWVFQLDFFDRDDPPFRRAVYAAQRRGESDREQLRRVVACTIDQLNRSRVLYIQSRVL